MLKNKESSYTKIIKGDVGPMGPRGPIGPRGPQGLQGPKGDNGKDGLLGNFLGDFVENTIYQEGSVVRMQNKNPSGLYIFKNNEWHLLLKDGNTFQFNDDIDDMIKNLDLDNNKIIYKEIKEKQIINSKKSNIIFDNEPIIIQKGLNKILIDLSIKGAEKIALIMSTNNLEKKKNFYLEYNEMNNCQHTFILNSNEKTEIIFKIEIYHDHDHEDNIVIDKDSFVFIENY